MLASEQPSAPAFVAPQTSVSAGTPPSAPSNDRASARRKRAPLAIVACIGKGGAGKTTTATNLAVLARREGYRAAIIDADPQQSSTAWRSVRPRNDIAVVRCNPADLHDTVEAARRAGVEVLYIDMPPDLRHVPAVARHADFVLLPMRPTIFDLKVTVGLVPVLAAVGVDYGVVLNAAPPRRENGDAPMVRQAREALARTRSWRRQITHRVSVPNAALLGAGVVEIERAGLAAQEYGLLWSAVHRRLALKGHKDENAPTYAGSRTGR